MKTLRIGSRRSALAKTQAGWITEQLRQKFPETNIQVILITTSGDQHVSNDPSVSAPGGLKAMFTKEIEEGLLSGTIDLAVHSMKDMAAELPAGLWIGAVPEREDPRDAWISRDGTPFAQLPLKARVATGAIRRQAQLRRLRPDLAIEPLRGNIDTRLRKLRDGTWDGLVLATAGLKRLRQQSAITEILSPDLVLPAIGQGALAIECRQERPELQPYLKVLEHAPTRLAITAERAFLQCLGGSCQTPLAAYAEIQDQALALSGRVFSPDGKEYLEEKLSGASDQATALGQQLAKTLLDQGAGKLLSGLSHGA